MSEHPHSPYRTLQDLVGRRRAGEVDEEGFGRGLDVVEAHLDEWRRRLESIPVPAFYPEAERNAARCAAALAALREAVEQLRAGDEDGALTRAFQAHEELAALLEDTRDRRAEQQGRQEEERQLRRILNLSRPAHDV